MKSSLHDEFLKQPSSDMLNSKVFGSNKTKGLKQDSQNRPRTPIPDGGEP